MAVLAWLVENKVVILSVLLALSEALSLIPAVKANGVAQLIMGLIAKAAKAVKPAEVEKQ